MATWQYMAPYQSTEGAVWMSGIPCTIGIMCVLYRGHFGWHCPFDVQTLHYKYITARKYKMQHWHLIHMTQVAYRWSDPGFHWSQTVLLLYHIHTLQLQNRTKLFCNCERTYYYFQYTCFTFLLGVYQLTYMYVQTYRCITLMFYPIYQIYSEWVQWNLSIKDTLNKGHFSNEDNVCSPNHRAVHKSTSELGTPLYIGQTAGSKWCLL